MVVNGHPKFERTVILRYSSAVNTPSDRGRAEQLGAALGRAADRAGQALGAVFRFPGLVRPNDKALPRPAPGAAAGIESAGSALHEPPVAGTVFIRCIDYGPEQVEDREIENLEAFLQAPMPEDTAVRWVNIDGLHPYVIHQFKQAYEFHTLAAEDVLHVPQRPRVEPYDRHLFIALQMLTLQDDAVLAEQVTAFLFDRVVITFQERRGDIWDPIRRRLHTATSRIRSRSADFLLYSLLDAAVDHCFPLMEHYGEYTEHLEVDILQNPEPKMLQRVQGIRRELSSFRKVLWPTRELIDQLLRYEGPRVQSETRTFLRDVHTHIVQLLDMVETYREVCSTLTDLYMSAVSNRMNEVMKTLTIMATVFIPITFLAGVYGMNFKYLPELDWPYAYHSFWGVCGVTTTGLLIYFRKKRWI